MKPGDLVRIDADSFFQGIGLIVQVEEVEEYKKEVVYLVLESAGYQHYYYKDELEVIDEVG